MPDNLWDHLKPEDLSKQYTPPGEPTEQEIDALLEELKRDIEREALQQEMEREAMRQLWDDAARENEKGPKDD